MFFFDRLQTGCKPVAKVACKVLFDFWLTMRKDVLVDVPDVLDKKISCFTCSHGNYMFYVKTLESVDMEEEVYVLEREKPVDANELRAALLNLLAGKEEEEKQCEVTKKSTRVQQLGLKRNRKNKGIIVLCFVFCLAIVILAIVLVLLILVKTDSKFSLW